MERQEPTFGSDLKDLEFRSRTYRGPTRHGGHRDADGLPWKIGVAVGMAVLAALLIFNAYERYQARRDAAQAVAMFNHEMAKLEKELTADIRANYPRVPQPVATINPVPPGYRCMDGALLNRKGNSWVQITARSNHIYCPHGGSTADCYAVTPRSVGCVRR